MGVESSVSWLFVGADRPDRFARAAASGADEVILDLEDAVATPAKLTAREHAVAWLSGDASGWVRINGHGSPWHDGDLDALVGCRGLRGVIVPKAEDAIALAAIVARLGGGRVIALVESARGVRDLDELCAVPGVARLAYGSIDLALDIDVRETDEVLRYARSRMVIGSRAAGLPAPIDGVTPAFRDRAAVADAAERARASGFGATLCIHPTQVPIVNRAFAPTEAELVWARGVLTAAQASSGGAFAMDGRMIDRPLVLRARRLLERAGEPGRR